MSKTACVYSALFGNIDEWVDPPESVKKPGWDFILYTDQEVKSKIYKVIKAAQMPNGPRLTSRIFKIRGFQTLLLNYDRVIWHDSNLIPKGPLDHLPGMFHVEHPFHDCVYAEIELCKKLNKDSHDRLDKAAKQLRKLGWPKHAGCYANGMQGWTAHPGNESMRIEWFDSLQEYTWRDQVFYPYFLAKNKIEKTTIPWKEALENFDFKPHKHKS